jgi:hypothetical protein
LHLHLLRSAEDADRQPFPFDQRRGGSGTLSAHRALESAADRSCWGEGDGFGQEGTEVSADKTDADDLAGMRAAFERNRQRMERRFPTIQWRAPIGRTRVEKAVTEAAMQGAVLDYSPGSAAGLERLIASWEQEARIALDLDDGARVADAVAPMLDIPALGAYYGELFVRHAGAAWGESGFVPAVARDCVTILPLDTVRRRVYDGSGVDLVQIFEQNAAAMARHCGEAEWLADTAPYPQFHFIDEREGDGRRLRLFWCACCRRVWDLLRLDSARRLVELAEACADGEATETELLAANASPDFAALDAHSTGRAGAGRQFSARVVDALNAARQLAVPTRDTFSIARTTSSDRTRDFTPDPGSGFGSGWVVPRDEAEWVIKLKLLRDIFGNPFHTVTLSPDWRTDTAVALARQMYEARDFSALPILADALQDAGCHTAEILDHCRGPGPHVRGCWVVDLVLAKSSAAADDSEPPSPPGTGS